MKHPITQEFAAHLICSLRCAVQTFAGMSNSWMEKINKQLPEGWRVEFSAQDARFVYVNVARGLRQFEPPSNRDRYVDSRAQPALTMACL
jgi:hypothetical protein